MKVLVLGCGNIGSIAAKDFAENVNSVEVFVGDKNVERVKEVVKAIDADNVSGIQLDASNYDKLAKALRDFDLVMGFLPGSLGFHLLKACVSVGRDLVDVSYMAENPLTLNDEAARKNVTIVPNCGLAPGISNILVGHAVRRLDKVQTVHIIVGGLPERPVPPLGYVITWSVESLIDEYTRKARIVKDCKMVDVEALSGLEEVEFPGVGRLEAFYTDGLRTLLHTVKGVESMWEKTLRYSGHAEKIKLLKALGFVDEKQIEVNSVSLSPRKLTVRLLEQRLRMPKVRDIVAMKVKVSGFKNGEHVCYTYHLLDQYDDKGGITAMARTTAYPASVIAQLILKEVTKERGIVPPERLGMSEEFFSVFWKELDKRGIVIREDVVIG